MTRWEYARLESTSAGVGVVFTHREAWPRQTPEEFFNTLRRLGDEGWELVSALPLTATITEKATQEKAVRFEPDRWLLFKREIIEPPPSQEKKGEDMLKGLVSRQLLKGRLPLP